MNIVQAALVHGPGNLAIVFDDTKGKIEFQGGAEASEVLVTLTYENGHSEMKSFNVTIEAYGHGGHQH